MTPSLFLHLANLHRPRRNGHVADDVDLRALAGFSKPVATKTGGDAAARLDKLAQMASYIADAITAGRVPLPVGDLNALARAAPSFQQLVAEPTRVAVRLEWSELATDPTAVLAARVAAELGAADLTRIRECARSECRLVFYDSTRSRTQRWHRGPLRTARTPATTPHPGARVGGGCRATHRVRIVTAHESAEDFIRRFLDTYEDHDLEALWTFYSVDCRFPILERFGIHATWKNYKVFMTRFIDAFPDLHHTIEKLVTDGDNVWALYTMTGTHRGPFRGVEPTGRQVRYPIVAMYRVVGELITEADFVSDDLRMMCQLGALPG